MLSFLLGIKGKPECSGIIADGLRQIETLTRTQAGWLNFTWFQHMDNTNHFTLFEQWQSQELLDAHIQTIIDIWNGITPYFEEEPISHPIKEVLEKDKSFSHVGLVCLDPVKTESFYTKYFGFTRVRVYAPGADQVVMLRTEGVCLELFKATEPMEGRPPNGAGHEYPCIRHLAFEVKNLSDKLAELGDDLVISQGPVDMGDFITGMRVCWIRDPVGNIIELSQGYADEIA